MESWCWLEGLREGGIWPDSVEERERGLGVLVAQEREDRYKISGAESGEKKGRLRVGG